MRLTNLKSLLFILIIGTSLSSTLSAQKIYFWLDAGLKASGGTGLLMNSQVLADRGITTEFGSTYGFGGKFGFNFGEFHAITIDAMYSSAAQTNRFRDESINSKKISFNAIDLYGLYRYNRNLNYAQYFSEGGEDVSIVEDYHSHNTQQQNVEGMKKLLLQLPIVKEAMRS